MRPLHQGGSFALLCGQVGAVGRPLAPSARAKSHPNLLDFAFGNSSCKPATQQTLSTPFGVQTSTNRASFGLMRPGDEISAGLSRLLQEQRKPAPARPAKFLLCSAPIEPHICMNFVRKLCAENGSIFSFRGCAPEPRLIYHLLKAQWTKQIEGMGG